MRHAGAWDKNSQRAYQNGPMAASGQYTIVLETAKKTYEQTFQLLADPRVLYQGVSLENMQAQEQLALQIIDLYSDAKKKAHELEKQLRNTKEGTEKYQAISTQIDQLVQAEGRYTQPKLLSQIRYLYYILSSSDMEPSRDVYDRYEELKKEFSLLSSD